MTDSLEAALAASGPEALQTYDERRAELGHDIVAAGYYRGEYVLSSGEPTDFYFDKYRFACQPTILRRLANLLAPRVPQEVDRLVARSLGATSAVVALALESGIAFAVLREEAGPGQAATVGELHRGERVLLVEDVVSTGRAALAAVTRLRGMGLEVVGVLAAIDRLDGAERLLSGDDVSLDALLRVDELLPQHTAGG